ncbi:tail fiber assembly protein [Jejubacter calystegiae]|uniref:Tail fiber assembly protein n=1 Tax=Jejubacter calystegiae TaxID=2579935 RepID=A0A4P8YQ77_9ENTR|nr:tail fiber assembly protein [Jejubacter calystegiae]QCT20852.1 tail fiber assembly protein [Jejubacter calystegiae]
MMNAILDSNNIATTAGELAVYNYAADTREYMSSSVEYLAVGVGIPANSAVDEPPAKKKGKAVCRNAAGAGWEYVSDHRGETVYSTEGGEAIEVTAPGEYPEGTTTITPATPYDKWDGEKWVTDTDAQHTSDVAAAEQQRTALLAEAQATISIWQTELQLGIISDDDKASLIAWLAYIKELQDVDTDVAPDIKWPEVNN